MSAQVIILGVAEICAIVVLGALHVLPGEAIAALLTTSIALRARLVAAETPGGSTGGAVSVSGPVNGQAPTVNAQAPKPPIASAGVLGLLLSVALARLGGPS